MRAYLTCFLALGFLAVSLGSTATGLEGKASTPFNGKDLTGWKLKGAEAKSKWTVGQCSVDPKNPGKLVVNKDNGGELVNAENGGVDISTDAKYGDCVIELEFMVPKGSNSGIYLMGEYEVQILDSYGKDKIGQGDLGAIYSAAVAKTNAAKKPGEWQRFVIDFQAPRFEKNNQKTANAKFVKVTLNDQVIHENVEVKGPTPGGLTGKEAPTGPIMFQGDHGPVAFRQIKVTPK
jgi:hypothetical protein